MQFFGALGTSPLLTLQDKPPFVVHKCTHFSMIAMVLKPTVWKWHAGLLKITSSWFRSRPKVSISGGGRRWQYFIQKPSWWNARVYVLTLKIFLFLVALGFELRDSCLLNKHTTTEALHQPYFALSILKIRSLYLPYLALNHDPPDLCFLSN
jgi:hypothetical protein